MRTCAIAVLLSLLVTACAPAIHGYALRRPRPDESRHVAKLLDPLLLALDLPSLATIARSKDCKIGFAIVRTERVNVWSAPASSAPCLYFTLFVTEGALKIPPDHLMATIAHELGHVLLLHTPQSDAPGFTVSAEDWAAIQAQELEADRFAVALLKRTRALYEVGACQAIGEFLRRSIPDWYGVQISTRMNEAVTQRAESADADCASTDLASPPWSSPAAGIPGEW
jgi:Zn-dependent protease with chaperone function